MHNTRPVIGITIGDPAGVGPEIVLGALTSANVYEQCVPVVIGHTGILRRCSETTGISAGSLEIISSPRQAKGIYETVEVAHVETPGMQDIEPGQLGRDAGLASEAFVRRACELGMAGEIDAVRRLDPDQVGNGAQRGMQQFDAVRLGIGGRVHGNGIGHQ